MLNLVDEEYKSFVKASYRQLNIVIINVRSHPPLFQLISLRLFPGVYLLCRWCAPRPHGEPLDQPQPGRPPAIPPPNPGEPPVIAPVQNAPPDGFYIAAALFYAGSILCLFATLFAIPVKWRLSNHLLHGGGSVIGRRANHQRKLDALRKRESDLFLEAPMHMLLVALAILACGALSLNVIFAVL